MTRKTTTKEVRTLYWDSLSLDEINGEIQRLIAEYGGNATVSLESHNYDDGYELLLYATALETDAEYAQRQASEALALAQREARDKATYLRLQAKFGKTE